MNGTFDASKEHISPRLKNFVPFRDSACLSSSELDDLFAGTEFLRRIAAICISTPDSQATTEPELSLKAS